MSYHPAIRMCSGAGHAYQNISNYTQVITWRQCCRKYGALLCPQTVCQYCFNLFPHQIVRVSHNLK